MIRVGFILTLNDASWTGGLVYFRNLLRVLNDFGSHNIQPVLIIPPEARDETLFQLQRLEIVRSHHIRPRSLRWRAAKVCQHVMGRDPWLESFLRRHRIDVLSHSGHLGPRARIPTLGWIPDFQHRYLPHLFSPAELTRRNARFTRLIQWCSAVIVSSEDTRQDMLNFAPGWDEKARILRVVAEWESPEQLPPLSVLEQRYDFRGPYFHLPNQFWAHKGHRVVIDALAELRRRGLRVQVLATGNIHDKRCPDFFPSLMTHVQHLELTAQFRVLGLVPYDDMLALMHHSLALINPSQFEGWSTSAEHSKSTGKPVLLSDIAVHLEQAPERAYYFRTGDPMALADTMAVIMTGNHTATNQTAAQGAKDKIASRRRQFAQDFETIVRSVAVNALHPSLPSPSLSATP